MYDFIEYTLYKRPPATWEHGYAEWILQCKDTIQMQMRDRGTVIGIKETETPNYIYIRYLYIPKNGMGTYEDLEAARLAFELEENHD